MASSNITSSSSPSPSSSDPLLAFTLTINRINMTPYFTIPSLLYVLLPAYVLFCTLFRFQRRNAMQRKYGYHTRESLKNMTSVEAQEIMTYVAELEFPKLYLMSVQFALFKTYGIPTISELLVATKEFSTPANASKRYADTGVLISEFSSHHPKSPRVLKAIARMNYIHSNYQKSGKISNSDLLYTLSVFITEPISWTSRYEWRSMTPMEICAVSTFWKGIGDAMSISYHELKRNGNWKDGLDFNQDITEWAQNYEKLYMVPAESNKTADELVPLLLFYVPGWAVPMATDVVGVMMGNRLRKSMMYPSPSSLSTSLVKTVFTIRRYVTLFLLPPRPSFLRVRQVPDRADPVTGRFNLSDYLAHPFYNKPTFWNRWGPEGLLVRLAGGIVPGGKEYLPEGYKFEEVGPRRMEGKGLKEMEEQEAKIQEVRGVGCPFARI